MLALLALLLPGICHAVIHLQAMGRFIPVIPLFTHNGLVYAIPSPTSLGGRAVAALHFFHPGSVHGWDLESATNQELLLCKWHPSAGQAIFFQY